MDGPNQSADDGPGGTNGRSPWLHVISEIPPGGPNGHGITLERVLKTLGSTYRLSVCCEKLDSNIALAQAADAALTVDLFSLPSRFKLNHAVQVARWLRRRPLTETLERYLSERSNGVVLATPVGYGALFRAGLEAAWDSGIPTAIWAMDDWVAAVSRNYPYLAKTADRFMAVAVNRSPALFAISPEMAQLFEKRWGGKWEVLANYLRATKTSPITRQIQPSKIGRRIGFFGDVYAVQADALVCFSQACARRGAELVIYGNVDPRYRKCDWGTTTVFMGRVTPAEADTLMRKCDILYLPFGFDSEVRWMVTTSFPTKLADYAAAGLPVIIHGPADSTIVRFARRHQWGCILDTLHLETVCAGVAETQKNYAWYAARADTALSSIVGEIGHDVIGRRLSNALACALAQTN